MRKVDRRKVGGPVTVCVAAIAAYPGGRILIGASDRMLTDGDIEFEQEQMKIHSLTSSIVVMIAGDIAIQTELLIQVQAWATGLINATPNEWLLVKDAADQFRAAVVELRRQKAADAILAPLDLDYGTLVSGAVASDLQLQLSKELLDFQIGPIEAIIMGMDTTGAHIYVVGERGVSCQDWVGFAAIGGGAWHANSQLMFAGHVKTRDFTEALMSVYTAKRRAEVAPGVGEATDMIVVGPGLGETIIVGGPLETLLKETYAEVRVQAENVRRNANERINHFFQEAVRDTPISTQATPTLEAGTPGTEPPEPAATEPPPQNAVE